MRDPRPRVMIVTLALALGLAGSTGSALAQQGGGPGAAEERAATWRAELAEAHQMLTDERYDAARDLTAKLADDMMEHLGAGEQARYTMAVVAAFRGIAEVGLGNDEVGLWYWRIATALHPPFAERDLTAYGEPAIWLTEQRYRAGYQEPPAGSALMEPRPREQPPVAPPASIADLETADVTVVVETVVGMDGVPREPRVVTAPEVPAVVYAVLEGIKDWIFLPATFDGKPVAMVHEVTIELGG